MRDAIHRWASTHMLSMFAKFKQTTHKEVDDNFKTKCADFTGKAATALKDSRHDTMLERTKADNQHFLKGLTTRLASSATATARQRTAPSFDSS